MKNQLSKRSAGRALLLGCGLIALSFFLNSAFAQDSKKDYDKDFFYKKYGIRDTTYYGEIQRAWKAMEGLSYAGVFPVALPLGERRLDLRDGEGRDGYILEANLDFRFPLMMGRPNANNTLFRRMRWTFDYRNNFRMTLDSSKPIVPYSNYVGTGIDFTFRDNKAGWFWQDKDPSKRVALEKGDTLKFTTLIVQVHHYSNGQRPGFYYFNADSSDFRNDYLEGDFSTNYFKFTLVQSWVNNDRHSLTNLSVTYRQDFGGTNGALNFAPEMRRAYGKQRISAMLDWYSGVYGSLEHKKEWHVRGNIECIVDSDLSNFRPNLVGSDNKFRLSADLILEWRPMKNRTVGYMLHFFAGRDYLNVRYDDIIFMAQGGITLALDKYYPVGWRQLYTDGHK